MPSVGSLVLNFVTLAAGDGWNFRRLLELRGVDVRLGHEVTLASYTQEFEEAMDPAASLVDELRHGGRGLSDREYRTLLGCFGFSGEAADKRIGVLSGGKKTLMGIGGFAILCLLAYLLASLIIGILPGRKTSRTAAGFAPSLPAQRRRFVLAVGVAVHGSSGQGCFG